MADLAQLERALFNADAAGDTQAATMLANEIRRMRAPSAVSQEASVSTAAETGPFEAAAVAAGQGFDKAAMGLKELALKGVRAVAPDSFASAANQELQALAKQEAEKDSAYAGLRAKYPFTTGMGEAATPMMVSGGMGLGPAALTQGLFSAMKPGSTEDRLKRGAVDAGGALVGGYVGNKVANVIAPVTNKAMTEAQREALAAAERMGYKPRLSEVTGSPYIARLEDFAARTPGGAGVMENFRQANQAAVNRHAASGIGEKADELTAGVFAAANQRIGQVFETLKSLPGKPIAIGRNVGATADDILRIQGKMIGADRDAGLTALAEQAKLLARSNGRIDGEAYQLLRSGLSNQSHEATGTNKALYGRLLAALDDSAEQSLRTQGLGKLADEIKRARPEWANLKTLEKGAVSKGGDVTPSAVATAMRGNNPAAFREGRLAGNPLYDVAVVGERLRPLQAGSPTYERQVTSGLLDTALKAGPAWAAAQLTTGSVPRGYASLLATNPTAGLLAQQIEKIADPSSRALGGLLAQRFLLPTVPILAE